MKSDQAARFAERLEPKARILDLSEQGYVVWDCTPIYGPDGQVHVFFTRVPPPPEDWFKSFRTTAEIVHAVAPQPEGPYEIREVVVKGRGEGFWDANGTVNPRVYKVGTTGTSQATWTRRWSSWMNDGKRSTFL